METKTYFANNVPAALEVARQELGPDAILLHSKPAPEDFRHLGRLEIVFAWEPPPASDNGGYTGFEPAMSEIDQIRQQLASLQTAIAERRMETEKPADTNDALETRLYDAGFSRELAQQIAVSVSSPGQTNPREIYDEKIALQRDLTRRIPVAPAFEVKTGETRTLAFIGPPGRGKTTSLVKLAIRLGIRQKVPVRILVAGVHAVGGREQLARYAAILGVAQQSFETLQSLHLAMNGDAWKGLVLIDTPGLAPSDQSEMRDFAAFFTARPEIEKHLVLRASERAADLLASVDRFSALRPSRLLFTGLDEASNMAAAAGTLIQTTTPCAFAGTGQRIPEDLYEMDVVSLARRLTESLYASLPKPSARAAGVGS